jgi:hypothetical protein
MKKQLPFILLLLLAPALLPAQQSPLRSHHWVDITGTIGNAEGAVSLAYVRQWEIGHSKRWQLGAGLRNTIYTGTQKNFITAGPAKYTRSFTAPFLIFFAGQKEMNFDTLQVQKPLTNSLNITANIGYAISANWFAGFNIDVIGFSVGRKTGGVFTGTNQSGQQGNFTDVKVKPTPFNVLLTGDNDRGSLNSEFFLTYHLTKKYWIKGVYQFLFEEYQTNTVQQAIPNGPLNNRFRNKANLFGVGITYHL